MSELPDSWAAAELAVLSQIIMGQAPPGSASNFAGVGTPFVKAGEFGNERPIIREWTTRPIRLAEKGDVLVCVVGATAGKVNLGADSAIGRSVAAIRPHEGMDQHYLYAFMKTQVAHLRRSSTGTAQGVLTRAQLGAIQVPVAPLLEQRRIVARIDRLNARAASARAALLQIPKLISECRSAILDLAFSGKLTGDLRGDHDGLPEGWQVSSLGGIGEIRGGVQVGKKRSAPDGLVEVPYLRVANVQRGWLDLSDVKTIEVTAEERDRALLQVGDVLMNEGGDRDKLGRGWIWSGQLPECIHQNHVFRIRLKPGIVPPEYVSHYANAKGQEYFAGQSTQTTNLASINKKKVSALPIPLPPFNEAMEIVRRIEVAFAWLDRLAAQHASAAKLLEELEPAILAKAFRGELEAQDVSDGTTLALLERISEARSEQITQPAVKTRRQKSIQEVPMAGRKTLEEVLVEASDWMTASAAFQLCGVGNGAETDELEGIYSQLRALDVLGKIEIETVSDDQGRKIHDLIRLKAA